MTAVRLEHISKRFGSVAAVDDLDLQIGAGELFFLVGPSGCGKTTLLRLIAGLHQATSGRIFFNERDVTELDTRHRNAVMCFQSYALWPHMNVAENVRFGLGVRGVDGPAQRRRVADMLELVKLTGFEGRMPNQLSGGQQQRLALARALAVGPDCLLLDEPLSNLDAKLRVEMRGEIRRICKAAGSTTIYVTHDQKEALSVADRIALMKDGMLIQVGTPAELYYRPRTAFVADFLGQTNLIKGEVISKEGDGVEVQTAVGRIVATAAGAIGKTVYVSIRPELIRLASGKEASGKEGTNRLVGRVVRTSFLGEASEHVVSVNGSEIKVMRTPPALDAPAEMVVEFDRADALALPV